MKDANCHDLPLHWFFPETDEEDLEVDENGKEVRRYARRGAYDQGREICSGCRVRDECLDYALKHQIKFGLWGGTSPRERINIRRTRRSSVEGQ